MWTVLFGIAAAVAACFGLAAIILQWRDKDRDLVRMVGASSAKPSLRGLPVSALQRPILLVDRMKSLGLDPDGFARIEPAVFQELSRRCRACDSTDSCASDLARNSYDAMNREWRDYCPNAPTLNMLGVLRDCYSSLASREVGG